MIQKGDFIEIGYTGRLDDGTVFDTTEEKIAKDAGLNPKTPYKPLIMCIGEGQLIRGLEEFLIGKELGKHQVSLTADKAFGKKDTKLLKLIPLQKFKEAKVEPRPGLEVNVDNHYGIVRNVGGGRVTVDFNHPLAGKKVAYDLEVIRMVEDPATKIEALLSLAGIHHHGVKMETPEHAVIAVHQLLPQPVVESLNAMITRLTGVPTLSYETVADH